MRYPFRPCDCLAALAAAAALLCGAAQAASGLRSEKDVLYAASLGYLTATEDWDGAGDLQDNDCRSQYTGLSHYAEYGFNYYYTGFAKLALAESRCADAARTGFSDLKLGLRGRINRYRNDRAWEVEATIPTRRGEVSGRRLGCGAFGVAGNVDFKDEYATNQFLEYGASVQLWESPLAHQFKANVGGSGYITNRWSWNLGLLGSVPLTDGSGDPGTLLSDCGTEGRVVRATTGARFKLSDFTSFHCGLTVSLWGRDASRSTGYSCGFARLWKG